MKKIKLLLNLFVESYKKNFCFEKPDQIPVADKRNKYLAIVLLSFLLVNISVLFWGFWNDYYSVEDSGKWLFYVVHICTALFNGILLFAVKRTKNNYIVKSFPVFLMNLCYFAINLWDLYIGGFFYTAYMTFAVHGIICCLLFEINPIIWTGMVIFMLAGYGRVETDYIRYLNIIVYAVANILLCWWKRYTKVQNLRFVRNLKEEKQKNEELLLNILPEKIVQELKETGNTNPEKFEEVSILFTDFVSFTKTSQNLEPEFLISELNEIFTKFDSITEAYDCQRIKTIGDSYLAVSGLPERCSDHAERLVKCAKEFIRYLEERNQNSVVKWQMRIGINSGAVTAGIVGTKKYLYDIFGDSVNTASRMESNSEPMKINVSEKTKQLLEGKFVFQERSPVEVKGKGLMTMYFVE